MLSDVVILWTLKWCQTYPNKVKALTATTHNEVLSGDQQCQCGALSHSIVLWWGRQRQSLKQQTLTLQCSPRSPEKTSLQSLSTSILPASYRNSRSYRQVPVSNRSEIAWLRQRQETEIRFSAGAFLFTIESTLAQEPTQCVQWTFFAVLYRPES